MTRHGSLVDQLSAFMAYQQRPAGATPDEPDEPITPIHTNWSITPANDNNPEDVAGMRIERRWRMKPSIADMVKRLEDVVFDDRGNPVSGVFERRNGTIVRLGGLNFSDGTQTEQAHKLTIDGKVVPFQARMPAGALLGCKDAAETQLGSDENPSEVTESNHYFADVLKVPVPRYKPGSKRKRGKSYTVVESRIILADAKANTTVMPEVVECPDGLACGTMKIADMFVGMKKGRCAESGSLLWQDITTRLVDREIWAETVANLPKETIDVLEVAATARNMQAVGSSIGFHGKTAERRGKRALIAANDNLMDALRRATA